MKTPFTDTELEALWKEDTTSEQQVAFERALHKSGIIEVPETARRNIIEKTGSFERPLHKHKEKKVEQNSALSTYFNKTTFIAVPAFSVLLIMLSFSFERSIYGKVTTPTHYLGAEMSSISVSEDDVFDDTADELLDSLQIEDKILAQVVFAPEDEEALTQELIDIEDEI